MMGWADYLSKHPIGEAKLVSKYDEKFVIATLTRTKRVLGLKLSSNHNTGQTGLENESRTESKSTPKAKRTKFTRCSKTAQSTSFIELLKSIPYLQNLETEVIPHQTQKMLSSLNVFARGSPVSSESNADLANQLKEEKGSQTDGPIEEVERLT